MEEAEPRFPGGGGEQGLRRGSGELVFIGDRVSVWEDEKVLEMMW